MCTWDRIQEYYKFFNLEIIYFNPHDLHKK